MAGAKLVKMDALPFNPAAVGAREPCGPVYADWASLALWPHPEPAYADFAIVDPDRISPRPLNCQLIR